MYRSVVKRSISLISSTYRSTTTNLHGRQSPLIPISCHLSTTNSNTPPPHPLAHQNPSPISHEQNPPPLTDPETLASDTASAAAGAAAGGDESTRHENQGAREEQRKRRSEYQEEQVRLLQAALPHVVRLGWSEAAMILGAKEVGVSPSIIGSFPRKEAALVEFFMDECLRRLIYRIDTEEDLKNLLPSDRVAKLVRIRLEMQAPYIAKWAQALSIQAQPTNIPTSFKQRAMLVDEIWHASGDQATDIDWYMKRTVLGGIYSATEVYMLTDDSPGFRDTWTFLNNRVKDSFDIGKTVKEATYLAEAVGAGIGNTLQGFMKGMSRS